MCIVALTTAVILNKSFSSEDFGELYFYLLLLLVIANIWTWVLHRKGVLNDVVGPLLKE